MNIHHTETLRRAFAVRHKPGTMTGWPTLIAELRKELSHISPRYAGDELLPVFDALAAFYEEHHAD